MHRREQIRQKMAQVLIAGVPLVVGRVYPARVYPMDNAALPGICLFMTDESGSLETTAGLPRISQRVLEVEVMIYTKGGADISGDLAAIAEQVEIALGNNTDLDGLALDLYLSSYSETLNANQVDRPQLEKTGLGANLYQVLYDVSENNPA